VRKLALPLAAAMVLFGAGRATGQSGRYVVIVNLSNPTVTLSATEVQKIFLGKLQAWKINGQLQPVNPVDQRPDSPVRVAFTQNVLRRSIGEVEAYWRQEVYAGRSFPPVEQSEMEAIVSVREMVGAIAYVSANADLKGVKVLHVQ
jgi:ABC-type phosphate transport system substrate-binding protein